MRTFAILKPDAIQRGLVGEIINRIERKGFEIMRMELRAKTAEWCRRHYSQFDPAVTKDREIYERLQRAMIYKPLIGILLEGDIDHGIRTLRNLVGATNSMEAAPGTIRGDFGTLPIHLNLIHASASVEAVQREVALFFNDDTDWN
jgi:nucleoside-diphosphate kinase